MCFVCNGFKKDENTKHCNYCMKCVEGFDHHCYWVNNCISKKNFKFFMFFIILIIINLSLNTCISFGTFIRNFHKNDNKNIKRKISNLHKDKEKILKNNSIKNQENEIYIFRNKFAIETKSKTKIECKNKIFIFNRFSTFIFERFFL